jgi:hypothetical protein
MINSEYILSVRRKVIDGSFTHVMLDINIYNKITIPAWFILAIFQQGIVIGLNEGWMIPAID